MNIEIIGTVCIDKNTSENAQYISAGSPPIFMDKIFRQFNDSSVTIVASYGSDFLPYLSGVKILPSSPNADKTLVYENISKGGQRTQRSYNRDQAFAVNLDEEIAGALKSADIVFFAPQQPIFSKEYIESVARNLRPDALKVLLPQGFYRNFDASDNVLVRDFTEADEILPFMNIVIVSEQDADNMLKQAKEWSSKFKIIAVVTTGEKGAVAFKNGEEIVLPANPVPASEVVDSVGSGDIFSASFAYRYKQTGNLEEAGKFANSVARQCLFYAANDIKIDLSKI